jgi:ABC-type phosphate transport system ATPase subunit
MSISFLSAVARSHAQEPQYLLMDELSSNLDPILNESGMKKNDLEKSLYACITSEHAC